MKAIESVEQWGILAAELRSAGYTIWQMQYAADEPPGFHAWFWAPGRPEMHMVTHNVAVQEAIVSY